MTVSAGRSHSMRPGDEYFQYGSTDLQPGRDESSPRVGRYFPLKAPLPRMSMGGSGQLQELQQELQVLESKRQELEAEVETLQEEKREIDEAIEGLETLETGSIVHVPLGGEAYVRAAVEDIDEVVVGLGGGYAAEETREEATETLENKKERLDDRIDEVRSEISEVEEQTRELEQRAQQAQQQLLQQAAQRQQQGQDRE